MAYFPEFRPMRSFILQNFRSDNDRPKVWRWLYKQHVPESISQFMPYCTKYCTYHALPLPEGALDFGTYNGMMTEHYWLFNIFQSKGTGMPARARLRRGVPRGLHGDDLPAAQQGAAAVRAGRGAATATTPWSSPSPRSSGRTTSRGAGRLTDDGPNFRWLFLLTYPEGVSIDEGDAWFKEVFAPEVCANPEVTRFISSRQLDDPRINPFQRISEVWFDDSRGVAPGHGREGRSSTPSRLGPPGTSRPSSNRSRTSWGCSSSTGPSPTTCSSGGGTSRPDERAEP